MTWTWITSLIPIAKEVIEGIVGLKKGPKKRKEIEEKVTQRVLEVYSRQFAPINRDIGIIRGWKPILARIQGVDIILSRWELLAFLSYKHREKEVIEEIISEIISEKKIEQLLKEVASIKTTMTTLSKEAGITWFEGGTDLRASINNLEKKLNDLKDDFSLEKKNLSKQMEKLVVNSREAQEETVYFFAFWDNILKELVESSKNASKEFEKKLAPALKSEFPTIKSDYPTESWDDFVRGIIDKVGELDFGEEQ